MLIEVFQEQDLHLKPVVLQLIPTDGMQSILGKYKRYIEELEQEEAPKKKRTCKQYKCEIHKQEDDNPAPIISKKQLCPCVSLKSL